MKRQSVSHVQTGTRQTVYKVDSAADVWIVLVASNTSLMLCATADGVRMVHVRQVNPARNTSFITCKAINGVIGIYLLFMMDKGEHLMNAVDGDV